MKIFALVVSLCALIALLSKRRVDRYDLEHYIDNQ